MDDVGFDERMIRLECLRLAVGMGSGYGDPVENARRLADFVIGTPGSERRPITANTPAA